MAYAAKSDIENVFGIANVARWSQLTPSSTSADATRIAQALSLADSEINSRFRGSRYAVPLSGSDSAVVTDWAAKLAGVWLYNNRGFKAASEDDETNKIRKHAVMVHKDMAKVFSGQRDLDLAYDRPSTEAPEMIA